MISQTNEIDTATVSPFVLGNVAPPASCRDCIRRVLHSARTRPLAMREPEYGNALAELSLMLADCIGHRPETYNREWLKVLATWQNRHIDAVTGGER